MPRVVKHARKYESTAESLGESNFELDLGTLSQQPVERGLATFQDQEEQSTTVAADAVPVPLLHNPYPDQTASTIMTRWYFVDTLTLTKTTAVGSYRMTPFYTLLSQAVLQDTLVSFRYLKFSAIELRFQSSTMPQMYGWVGYSSYPRGMLVSASVAPRPYPALSFEDAIIFDLAVQNDVSAIIPWRSPDQWVDWYDQFQLGTLNYIDDRLNCAELFWPQNPVHVLQSTSAPSVTFQVFARFVNPTTAGHVNSLDDLQYETQSFMKHVTGLESVVNVLEGTINLPFFRGNNVNDEHRDEIMPHYNKTNAESSASPSIPPNDPDLRNNPLGSLSYSSARYVAGSGTQLAPSHSYSVKSIIRMPTLVYEGSILSSDTLRWMFSCNPARGHYSRISYMSQMFRMWRGSIDYTFVFFSTPFISARFNLVVAYGKTAPTGTIGNEIIKDVTIRGTTIVHITVPFLNGGQWAPTNWQNNAAYDALVPYPNIYLKVIQAPVSVGDVASDIPFLAFERAGQDFEFRSLISPAPDFVDVPDQYEVQMMVAKLMGGEVTGAGSIPALPNSSDTELTVADMCRRWSGRKIAGTQFQRPAPIKTPYAPLGIYLPTMGVFDTVAQLFVYWSGQIRIKAEMLVDGAQVLCWHSENYITTNGVDGMERCQRPEDGMVAIESELTRILDVTCPFLATTQILPILDPRSSVDYNSFPLTTYPRYWWPGYGHYEDGTDLDYKLFYIAGGDDYSLYLPLPPPAVGQWPSYGFNPLDKDPRLELASHEKLKLKSSSSTQSCTGSEEFQSA